MDAFRHILLARRRIAFAVIALALTIKALVPAGFMIDTRDHVLTITICADATSGHLISKQIVIPGKPVQNQTAQAKNGEACAFSGLALAGLAGTDPALLAQALAFILLLGFASVAPLRIAFARRIRPPLRAPPVFV